MAASTARVHEIQNAARQPYAELADPATMEPSIWPVMSANSMRPIATCRPAMSYASPSAASTSGTRPPPKTPAIMRDANSASKVGATAPNSRAAASPAMQTRMQRRRPKRSLMGPRNGCDNRVREGRKPGSASLPGWWPRRSATPPAGSADRSAAAKNCWRRRRRRGPGTSTWTGRCAECGASLWRHWPRAQCQPGTSRLPRSTARAQKAGAAVSVQMPAT